MITKREVKELLKGYILEGDKILDIDMDGIDSGLPIWALVKSNGLIYHYSIYNWELGSEYIEVYNGIILRSNINTVKIG